MPRGRAARRLELLAQPLKPTRAPFYVRQPVSPGLEKTYPAAGWYWVPHGHPFAVFLAASEISAAIALTELTLRELSTAND